MATRARSEAGDAGPLELERLRAENAALRRELAEVEHWRAENAALRRELAEVEHWRAELLHQRAALRTVLSSIPYSVFWKDRASVYMGCNDSFAALAGLAQPDDIIGKCDYDMPWTREESEAYRACDRDVIDRERSLADIEEQLLDADGRQKVILTSKVPLRAEDGAVIGMVGIFTDITARKQMELDLQKAKEVAEEASRAKSDFLATVSHELRTPLALILGPLETLVARPELSAAARRDGARVLRNAWRLKNLVDDILEFGKGDARMTTPHVESIDVVELTRALIDEVQTTAANRDITLTFATDPLPDVVLDPQMFERILLNLLGNALKFTPARGRVEVTIAAHGDRFELAVRDTGIGIHRDDQGRLFQRFQQIDTSSTRRYEGTGLGLAIVKQFAELLGGSVSVESALGQGARFAVMLPRGAGVGAAAPPRLSWGARAGRAARVATTCEPSANPVAIATDARPLVVLAEDHADLRAYAAEVLGARWRVLSYANGAEALAGVRAHRPAVVVSDVMMPLVDGHELVSAMKADPELRQIPIILLTAQTGRDVVVESLENGADDFLNKPFSAPELVARVAVAVRLHAAYDELSARNVELVQTRDMLIEAEKLSALGRLLSQLSHEINNPMTAIIGNLPCAVEYLAVLAKMIGEYRAATERLDGEGEGLRRRHAELAIDFVTEDFASLLQTVEEAAGRVQAIQRDLRAFLRGDPVVTDLGDPNEALRITVEMLKRGLSPQVVLEVTYGPLPPVRFNAGQLKQVFLNILQNAVDAVSPHGRIEVATWADPATVTIAVTDSGPGVPAELRSRIFEPFFTTKEVGQGTGIGLAVSRQIVTAHGGRIWLAEASSRGAGFIIELPRADLATPELAAR